MRVLVNVAMSADGKLSTVRREQVVISGPQDFDRVEELRASHDGVAVGIGTVLADDPSLTVSSSDDAPARVVFDSAARTPRDAAVLSGPTPTHVLVGENAPPENRNALEGAGAVVHVAGSDRVDPTAAMETLEAAGIESLMVEGGGELIFSLFEAGLVDEFRQFVGPTIIGGRKAPTVADGAGFVETVSDLALERVDRLDDGVMLRWTVRG